MQASRRDGMARLPRQAAAVDVDVLDGPRAGRGEMATALRQEPLGRGEDRLGMSGSAFSITFVVPDYESLGVEYLISACRERGHRVSLVLYATSDRYVELGRRNVRYEEVARKIAETSPDFVGFSCVTDTFQHQARCAAALKRLRPRAVTVFGGIHVTSVPRRVIELDPVDCICIGEGEVSLPRFLSRCRVTGADVLLPTEGIDGIVFKRKGSVIGACAPGPPPQLDRLPFPDKDLFSSVFREARVTYRAMGARGCLFRCSYCWNSCTEHGSYRARSVESLMDELRSAKLARRYRYVYFLDDCFNTDKDWLRDFSERYRRDVALPFACLVHPAQLDPETIDLLGDAGCIGVEVGVQSTDPVLCRRLLNRRYDEGRVRQAVAHLRRRKITVQIDHMLGLPGDSLKAQEESVLFYNGLRPNILSVFWLTYYPRTKIVDLARRSGLLTQEDVERIEDGSDLRRPGVHSPRRRSCDRRLYGIALLLNYLPLLPPFVVRLLVRLGIYRLLALRSYVLSTALPRLLLTLVNKGDFHARAHLLRLCGRVPSRGVRLQGAPSGSAEWRPAPSQSVLAPARARETSIAEERAP